MRQWIFRILSGWRGRAALGSVVAVGAAAVFAISALAVHDEDFQLDGDVSAATTTNVGGITQHFDWSSFFDAAGQKSPVLPDITRPGFTSSGFDRDFNLAANGAYNTDDQTTYTQGSKDTLNISSNWVCADANNVTNKGDIQNAYAVAYTDPATGEKKMYFALERNSNTGDANVAFWFLQDPTADCSTATGTKSWTGNHQNGDILVVSAFTNGGSVSTITAYQWAGGANGAIDPTPVASGADCRAPGQPLGDKICATANTQSITTPWLTNNNGKTNGNGHTLLTSEFFEGGISLTKTNLAGHCFNTFVGDTRSSQSLTATLFDFARGSLGGCTSTTETTPSPSGTVSIGAAASVSVHDSATVTVTGVDTFTGTLKFFICGPSAASSTATCDTGGTQIGSTQTITQNGSYDSANATVTSAGRYCWRADFTSGTDGVPNSSDSRSSECFTVAPVTPHLTTQAVASPVDFGQPVKDTATLTGTANQPGSGGGGSDGSINPTTAGGAAGGTITFTLYKNNCTTLATGTGTNPQTVNVSGDATYGPVSFTPDAPGTYHWVATYSGNPPNTNASPASDSVCGADPNEDVVVRQIPTDIKTKQSWFPNDTATITSTVAGNNLGANGTVDFTLYPSADCTGTALYTERQTLTGGANSEEVATHNYPGSTAQTPGGATVTPYRETTGYADAADSTVGPNSWKVEYTPAAGDTAHLPVSSACTTGHTEKHAITYSNDAGGHN